MEQQKPATEMSRNWAIGLARDACARLEELGVEAVVAGSLATGTYGAGSDIDLVVLRCPRERKYAIEAEVEDMLGGHPFDVIYLDEAPDWLSERLLREAVDARELR